MTALDSILVSIIIPVKNGAYWLRSSLQAILEQELPGSFEIIVIDSGSTDETLDILKEFPVRLIQIEPSQFNHGLTRNLGVEAARGRYVVMTVQDARPADNRWLQKMLEAFDAPEVAGVCGKQVVPHEPDKNPVEWFRPLSSPELVSYQYSNPLDFEALKPEEKRRVCGWDNVTAMYRKEVLTQIPFRKTDFAEDALWAKDALKAGYRIVYYPASRVFHYHHESEGYTYRRTLSVLYHFYNYFGWLPDRISMNLKWYLRLIKILVKSEKVNWLNKFHWLLYNIKLTQAVNRAIGDTRAAVQSGSENALIELHDTYCAEVPQAKK